jgi:hypothetical protein
MSFRPLAAVLAAAVVLVASVSACGDVNGPDATSEVATDTVEVYALNGAPARAPTVLSVIGRSAQRIDAGFGFDIALDIDAQNRVVLYTVRQVASPLVSTSRVGIQILPQTFESVTMAPKSGYKYDSLAVLPVGSTAVIEVFDPVCQLSIRGSSLYAKVALAEVALPERRVRLLIASDQNCGFRSLAPGLPKE